MTKTNLMEMLLVIPEEITSAELEVLGVEVRLLEAKETLRRVENTVLLGGALDGKNERVREAQLAELTERELATVAILRVEAVVAATQLRILQTRLAALQAVATLLTGGRQGG